MGHIVSSHSHTYTYTLKRRYSFHLILSQRLTQIYTHATTGWSDRFALNPKRLKTFYWPVVAGIYIVSIYVNVNISLLYIILYYYVLCVKYSHIYHNNYNKRNNTYIAYEMRTIEWWTYAWHPSVSRTVTVCIMYILYVSKYACVWIVEWSRVVNWLNIEMSYRS